MKAMAFIALAASSLCASVCLAEDAKTNERAAFIVKMRAAGIFGDVKCRSEGGDLVVKPAFYSLEFADKQSFVSVVYAYCLPSAPKYSSIKLLDSRSNKRVGDFSKESGLRMN